MRREIVQSLRGLAPQLVIGNVLENPAHLQSLLHIPEQTMSTARMFEPVERPAEVRQV